METIMQKVVVPTHEEIEKATYNELRKMAKDAQINLGRGVTAEQYREALLKVSECELPKEKPQPAPVAEIKPAEPKAESSLATAILASLEVGCKYSFKSSKKTYEIIEKDADKGKIKVSTDTGSWWESSLNREVLVVE